MTKDVPTAPADLSELFSPDDFEKGCDFTEHSSNVAHCMLRVVDQPKKTVRQAVGIASW